MNHPQSDQAEANAQRAAWMRVLALAESSELDGAFGALGTCPRTHMLRPAQSGMAMVRAQRRHRHAFQPGRDDADSLRGEPGERRGRHRLCGRSLRHAEQAAVADALLQLPEWHEAVQRQLIAPLARAARNAWRGRRRWRRTRVEFFTMVRE